MARKLSFQNRLIPGHRCRLKKENSLGHGYRGREVILTGKNNGEFSGLLLNHGENVHLLKKYGTVSKPLTGLKKEELKLVDDNLDTNTDFTRWYWKYFCPSCGYSDDDVLTKNFRYMHCPKCESKWG